MVGWHHHRLNAHEFEQALGVGDGQGSLACCSPWGFKELDTSVLLNNKGNKGYHHHHPLWGNGENKIFSKNT